jgi:hypothetical protein
VLSKKTNSYFLITGNAFCFTAKPEWKAQPRKVDVGVEETAIFECKADGIPKPDIQWFINGAPVDGIILYSYLFVYHYEILFSFKKFYFVLFPSFFLTNREYFLLIVIKTAE